MAFGEADLQTFLSDFGETAILEGGDEVSVIFDNEYVAASLLGIEVATSDPMAHGFTSDLGELKIEDEIEIQGVVYKVKEPPHSDGTGFTTLILKR